ncbi:MAG TPA: hypothetical protein VFG69_19150, partial [Nannocystaceae bacterium]|nr:hypothetical protein [Nannocystaceae bacterium]
EPPIEIEIVELKTLSSPTAVTAGDPGTSADVAVATPAPPPPPPEIVAPAPRKPVKPRPVPAAIAQPIPAGEPVESESLPVAPEPASAPPIAMLARPVASSRGSGGGTIGAGAGAGAGDDEDAFDRSRYGAEIVRILSRELDEHPVPGISERDSIQIVLTLLPNGELAWTRAGRYGFVDVLHSTLGPLRMRQVLKRIEIASARFPPHPHGLRSRHYTVDVTIRFSRPKH